MNIFLNTHSRLRNGWWIAVFFLILALLLFPLLLASRTYGFEVTMAHQMAIIIIASWVCLLLRKERIALLMGTPGPALLRNAGLGIAGGAFIMVVPAFFLVAGGWVSLLPQPLNLHLLFSITAGVIMAAVTEEFLFRGFIFQRMISGWGILAAQIVTSSLFLLTHINNPGMSGVTSILASVNIFIASLIFGFACIRSGSLVMPIVLHATANWFQGPIMGFGVSGNDQHAFYLATYNNGPEWLTGGKFGIEASLPGLIVVIIVLIGIIRWQPKAREISEESRLVSSTSP